MALRAFRRSNGLTSRSIRQGTILPSRLSRLITQGAYVLDPCNYLPRASKADGYSVPTGVTGDLNFLHFREMVAVYHILGAGQTILQPTPDATLGGLSFQLDAAAAEGHQGVFGGMQSAKNPFAVTIGTSPNAFIRVTLRAGTVANVAELAIGWRKAEAMQVNLDDYDELACLNMQAGNILRETILNNAATVSVDTTKDAVNATDFTLEVRLIGRQARMFVNDAEVAIGAPFNFDLSEVVVPFYFFLQGGGASTLNLMDVEIGPLYAIDMDPARR